MWDDNFLYRKSFRKVSRETRQAHQTNIRFYMTVNATQGELEENFQGKRMLMWIKINLGLNIDSVRELPASYFRYLTMLNKKRYLVHDHEHAHEHAHEQWHVGDNLFGEIQMYWRKVREVHVILVANIFRMGKASKMGGMSTCSNDRCFHGLTMAS